MMCNRYWREGIVLVERGGEDPHRGGCAECTHAHALRQEIIDALPLAGEGRTGNPHWQANVWRRIDGERKPAPPRWQWRFAAALAVACAVLLWLGRGWRGEELALRVDPVEGGEVRRSESPHVGGRVRITAEGAAEVRVYHSGRLIPPCPPGTTSNECVPRLDDSIIEMVLELPGEYSILAIASPVPALHGTFDADLAALEEANASYEPLTVQAR